MKSSIRHSFVKKKKIVFFTTLHELPNCQTISKWASFNPRPFFDGYLTHRVYRKSNSIDHLHLVQDAFGLFFFDFSSIECLHAQKSYRKLFHSAFSFLKLSTNSILRSMPFLKNRIEKKCRRNGVFHAIYSALFKCVVGSLYCNEWTCKVGGSFDFEKKEFLSFFSLLWKENFFTYKNSSVFFERNFVSTNIVFII